MAQSKTSVNMPHYARLSSLRLGEIIQSLPLVFLAFITIWFHFVNLGYSDYQGDEISALPLSSSEQSYADYLLQQKKGPVQFLVTSTVKVINPSFSNEFITRLPFALAGALAVFFFYRLAALHFGRKIALYASLFIATNGLFIGLTRIVQYQPFVMLFSIAALYAFSLAAQEEKWRVTGIYLGMLLWAGALLSHYDGVFIAPFAFYLLYRWYAEAPDLPRSAKIKHFLIAGSAAAFLLAVFYIPFLFSVSEDTQAYWAFRFAPKERGGVSSSVVTFRLYNPLLVFYIYVLLGHLSFAKIKNTLPVLLWFLFPWEVLELIIFDPGTHIYTYLIPAAILLAFGLVVIEEASAKIIGKFYGAALNYTGVAVLFVFLASLSHFLFIDHTPEYPWEERRLLFWTISKPETRGDLWVFGFPYYRHWDEIREFVTADNHTGYYATNETTAIADHYIPYTYDIDQSGYYIHIYNPQSFKANLAKDKIRYWLKNYEPVKVFEDHGRVSAEIYQLPPGSYQQILDEGY